MNAQPSLLFSFAALESEPVLRSLDGRVTKRAPDKRVKKTLKKPEFKSFAGKVWRERPMAQAVYDGLVADEMDSELAKIYARRIDDLDAVKMSLDPKLKDLDSPFLLPDVVEACNLLNEAIEGKKRIGLVCDFDADGMNSAAVLYSALVDYFHVSTDRVDLFIGQRLVEGYGLSDKLADRILAADNVPDIIITADCGSSDEARIAKLKEHGIDVIVTDHHSMPEEGHPKSSAACITPLRADCEYPDNKIAGCMVAWLFMSALRAKFMQTGRIPENAPNLKGLLDFVALATVADCVSLGDSKNNRAVVNFGLHLINQGVRPCWRAFREYIGGHDVNITAETLAFAIAPRLNARGRLSDAMTGVDFLLSDNDIVASEFALLLDQENQDRKLVEREMALTAVAEAKQQVLNGSDGVIVYLKDGHPGVHGIVASRITEKTGKPSIMLSPMGEQPNSDDVVLSGSCRSVEGIDVRAALQFVADKDPTIFIKFGGHHGAAGLTTHLSRVEDLRKLFDLAIKAQAGDKILLPILKTDGVIGSELVSLDFVDSMMRAAPFGQKFEYPVYEGDFYIEALRPVGQDKTHLSLTLSDGKRAFKGIWFGVRETADDDLPVIEGAGYRFAFSINENVYNGTSTVQLQIVDAMDRGIR